jgi:hypothetical protein
VIDLGRSCSRYRPLLEDFVDRGEVRPDTGAALEHLDRCSRCTEAIESTMLTITALRRLGDEIDTVEPAADAWPRLRNRITTWKRPVAMSPIAGIAMSIAIVVVMVLPFRVSGGAAVDFGDEATPMTDTRSVDADHRIEATYLAVSRRLPIGGSPQVTGSLPRNIPQEVWQVRKEVHSAKPSARAPEPI